MSYHRQSSILEYFSSLSNSNHQPSDQVDHILSKYFEKSLVDLKENDIVIIDEDNCENNKTECFVNVNDDKDNLNQIKINDDDKFVEMLKDKNFIKVDDFLEIIFRDNLENENDLFNSNYFIHKDYKLRHFRNTIDTVLNDDHYSHLFDEHDWNVLYTFTHLSYDAQVLYLRLLIRKSHWIRLNQMRYSDIDDIPSKLEELAKNHLLLTINSLNNVEESLNILDLNEVRELVKRLKMINVKSSSSKNVIIKAICRHIKENQPINFGFSSTTINQLILQQVKNMVQCFKIDSKISKVFVRIFLLYFPLNINDEEIGYNIGQDLFNLLKLDQGEIKYPPYEVNKMTKVFPEKENLILFEEACNLESELISLIESKNRDIICEKLFPLIKSSFDSLPNKVILFDQKLASYLRQFTAGHVLVRSLSSCVTVFEQLKRYSEACNLLEKLLFQSIYCQHYRGKWYERLILNIDKYLKRPNDTIDLLKIALLDKQVKGGHLYALYQKAQKLSLANKSTFPVFDELHFTLKQTCIKGRILKDGIEKRKYIFVTDDCEDGLIILNVEEVAIRHYQSLGYVSGIHCEGIVFNSLFGLLFWDIIYRHDSLTSDAFHSPFQSIPLDLNSDDFYFRRQSLIESQLDKIKLMSKVELIESIENVWNKYEGCLSLVDWEKCSLPLLKEIIECIDLKSLAAIFKRLSECYRFNRSGFPDLLLWNLEKKIIKAVEVKGPGDQLSSKQSLWLNFMNKCGLDAEVCYVKPQEGCLR